MIYYLPEPPASPISLAALRQRARRRGFLITRTQHIEVFSLVHAQLRRPIAGLDATTLAEVARAVELVPHGDLS